MFTSSPKILLFLNRNNLFVYGPKGQNSTIAFTPDVFANLEILNEENFVKQLSELLAKANLKGQKGVLILSSKDYFEKTINQKEPEKIKEFLENIPLEEGSKVVIKIEKQGDFLFLATNLKLIDLIRNCFTKAGGELEAASVAGSFPDLTSEASLGESQVSKILNNSNAIKSANFLNVDAQLTDTDLIRPDVPEESSKSDMEAENEPEVSEKRSSAPIITIVLILILVAALGVGTLMFRQNILTKMSNPQNPTPLPKEASQSGTPTEASESASTLKPEEVKVQILNGSGITGQASKAKDELLTLGLKEIETGNAENTDNTETSVSFSKNVSETLKNQIVKKLEEMFDPVTVKKDPPEKIDIQIITGLLK